MRITACVNDKMMTKRVCHTKRHNYLGLVAQSMYRVIADAARERRVMLAQVRKVGGYFLLYVVFLLGREFMQSTFDCHVHGVGVAAVFLGLYLRLHFVVR
jgi:hypothetical protein